MDTRTLSSNGPTASALGLGLMGMSDQYGPTDRTEYSLISRSPEAVRSA